MEDLHEGRFKRISPDEALKSLALKFTSGNGIPVSRANITREEFEAVRENIEGYRGLLKFIGVPAILLEHPTLFCGKDGKPHPVTDKDIEHTRALFSKLRISTPPSRKPS